MKEITIYDYSGKPTTFEVNLDEVEYIRILILTGDEIADVEYKDGHWDRYDSSDCRMESFYDDEYYVYDSRHGVNLLEDEEWLSSNDSYERIRY